MMQQTFFLRGPAIGGGFFRMAIVLAFCWLASYARAQTYALVGAATTTSSTSGPTVSTLSGPRTERHSAIYTAAELTAAGLVNGSLLIGIAWDKTAAGSYEAKDLTVNIYLKHTALATFATTSIPYAAEVATATQVYGSPGDNIDEAIGFVPFAFNMNNFTWDGINNIQVITEIIRPGNWVNTTFSWRVATVTNASSSSSAATAPANLSRSNLRPQIRFDVATPGNDAAMLFMSKPTNGPPGVQNVEVRFRNVGTTTLTSATFGYTVNGSAPTNFAWTGSVAPGGYATVIVGSPNLTIAIDTVVVTLTLPNGVPDVAPANNTLTKIVQICAPLSGHYTINNSLPTAGTNFRSFTDFSNTLSNCGMGGAVVATVDAGSGPYREQVVFQSITGLNATSTLTIKGNNRLVTSDTAILIANSNPNRYIFRFVSLQYVTVDSLDFYMQPGSTGFFAMQFLNSGFHIKVRHCNVDMRVSTSTLAGAFVFNGITTSLLGPGGTFDDVEISDNTTVGGGYGASVVGLAPPLAANVAIANNSFTDFNSNGVYMLATDGLIVRNNRFAKNPTVGTSLNAINFALSDNLNGQAYSNDIKLSSLGGTCRGIYVVAGTGFKIYNNTISSTGATDGNITGIAVRAAASAPQISFNTISFDEANATTGTMYGIIEELTGTLAVLRNNVVSISQPVTGTAVKAALVLASNTTAANCFNSDYNVLWVPGGNIGIKNATTKVLYPDLAAWKTAFNQDNSSSMADPQFTSPTLLRPTNAALNNTGTAIAGITTDILGITRGTPPDPGAYEFVAAITTYTFNGSGLWNVAANWTSGAIPPSPLPFGSEVIVDPTAGDCILNVPFTVGIGAKLTVKTGKNFLVQGNLTVQ